MAQPRRKRIRRWDQLPGKTIEEAFHWDKRRTGGEGGCLRLKLSDGYVADFYTDYRCHVAHIYDTDWERLIPTEPRDPCVLNGKTIDEITVPYRSKSYRDSFWVMLQLDNGERFAIQSEGRTNEILLWRPKEDD